MEAALTTAPTQKAVIIAPAQKASNNQKQIKKNAKILMNVQMSLFVISIVTTLLVPINVLVTKAIPYTVMVVSVLPSTVIRNCTRHQVMKIQMSACSQSSSSSVYALRCVSNIPGGTSVTAAIWRTLIPDNKTHCKDVTNCREKNGGCDQICREDQRGLLCSCQYGSVLDGDGHTCNDVNECLESNGGCEQLCVNTPGSFTCQCRRGYRPRDDSPYQCVSECVPPCLNYGVCVGPNTCVCPTGYGGQTCTPTCNPPCAHGGSCRRFNMCQCPVGYTGPACQKATCVLPCMNGGLCIGPNRCQCPARYTGERCETSKCVPECRNGGSCYASNTCLCPEGFYGPRCQN
ncbi:putative fibrillin-3, partial [Apostichopus japonicus]